jgi:hypothetical protein
VPGSVAQRRELSFKVSAARDVQAPSQQCVEDYLSDLSVGSNVEGPAVSREALKVVAPLPRRVWQTAGKMSASKAAAMITATQVESKKRTRVGPVVLTDTATASTDV